ncbi:MAG: hypothetical protein NT127_07960 [Sphingobacteriales bacterium]|nr:hypothetical protein [Sphingobacteriales bacterium]
MKAIKELNIKKIIITFLWICLGLGSLTLLVSGIHKKDNSVCKGYEIEIIGINNNFFIGKSEILEILEKVAGKNIKGQAINKLNLLEMENQIKKDVWISKATLYVDKNDILMVKVEEKNPIARVFSNQGTSFYIDHSLNMLPLSKTHSARLPINIDKKFDKLKLFYKNVISVKGWKKYSKINLEYENQIVASILGVEEQVADSLKTMKMIKEFAEYSAKMSSDTSSSLQQDNEKNTVNESMILNSIARDDEPEEANAIVIETSVPAVKTIVHSNTITPKKVEAAKTKVVIKDSKKAGKPKDDKKEQKKTLEKSKVSKARKPKVLKPKIKP